MARTYSCLVAMQPRRQPVRAYVLENELTQMTLSWWARKELCGAS